MALQTSPEYREAMEKKVSAIEWSKENIRAICENPLQGYNKKIVYRMLLALYEKQTEGEKIVGDTTERNGEGFNGTDANFLSSVAENAKRFGGLTDKQALWVGKKLRKYAGQLERIAKAN
jgi:hypothetical protein